MPESWCTESYYRTRVTLHLLNFPLLTELPGSTGRAVGVGVWLTFHLLYLALESKEVPGQLLQDKRFCFVFSPKNNPSENRGAGSTFICKQEMSYCLGRAKQSSCPTQHIFRTLGIESRSGDAGVERDEEKKRWKWKGELSLLHAYVTLAPALPGEIQPTPSVTQDHKHVLWTQHFGSSSLFLEQRI